MNPKSWKTRGFFTFSWPRLGGRGDEQVYSVLFFTMFFWRRASRPIKNRRVFPKKAPPPQVNLNLSWLMPSGWSRPLHLRCGRIWRFGPISGQNDKTWHTCKLSAWTCKRRNLSEVVGGCLLFVCLFVGWLVGWLVVLKVNVCYIHQHLRGLGFNRALSQHTVDNVCNRKRCAPTAASASTTCNSLPFYMVAELCRQQGNSGATHNNKHKLWWNFSNIGRGLDPNTGSLNPKHQQQWHPQQQQVWTNNLQQHTVSSWNLQHTMVPTQHLKSGAPNSKPTWACKTTSIHACYDEQQQHSKDSQNKS